MFIPRGHGFSDAVARGHHLRMPLRRQICELAVPRGEKPPTDATISLDDDGISAPVSKKYPLAQQVSRPPAPPSDDTSLPIDPPNALSTWCKPEGACEDSKKSSNRPDEKNLSSQPISRQIDALALPPCSARIREREQRSVSLMSRESSDGSAGGGQEDRLYIYYFLFIPLNFLLHLMSPPPHSIVHLLSPSQTVPKRLR